MGITEPFEPSTLPNLTAAIFILNVLPRVSISISAIALACAHNVGGIYRLVGGNENELIHPRRLGALDYVKRTHNVVFNRFGRGDFHHRHVLVSRGVENDFGFIQRKRFFEFVSFANRSDNERIPRRIVSFGEFLIKEEHSVFVLIENDEVPAPEIESLTAEFRTDRSRAARYHYDLASHRSVDKFLTDFELVSAEKFLDLDVAERFYRGSDIIRVGDCGHYFNGEIERRKRIVDMAKLRFRYGRYRDDKRFHLIVF